MSTQCFLSMLLHWVCKLDSEACRRMCGLVLKKFLAKGLPRGALLWWASLDPEACLGGPREERAADLWKVRVQDHRVCVEDVCRGLPFHPARLLLQPRA